MTAAIDRQDRGREASLLSELQHRVRNTLATTRMIARRSAETSESLEGYVAHLDGRLAALARVQNAAIRDPTAGIELGLLVSDELTSVGQAASGQSRTEGPSVLLHPRAADAVALALHELTTNAIKFGALSTPHGKLAVSWEIKEGEQDVAHLVFDWIETGVPLPEGAPRREGFGMVVLHQMLQHNLGAQTDTRLTTSGLVCRIILPLTDRVLARK